MPEYPRYSGVLEAAERLEFEPFLRQLAAASGAVICRHYAQGSAVATKADGSPVTAADREAEATMRSLIAKHYPDHGVLGEEMGMERADARYRWVLDPVDGTKAFVSRCFIFGTLISLLRDGRPILGAIAHPLTGHLMIGYGGAETRLNGQPVQVRECSSVADATLLATGHWEMVERWGGAYEALTRRARLYRTWGDCHGYFQLASGGADVMFDPVLKPWDICSFVPVIEGAGGVATSISGTDPLSATDLVACSRGLHAELLAALNTASE